MRVVEFGDEVISIRELRKQLEQKKGVLVWLDRKKVRFLKGPYKTFDGQTYSCGWVSLLFDRGQDSSSMREVTSLEELIEWITEVASTDSFFWFPSEKEFFEWASRNL